MATLEPQPLLRSAGPSSAGTAGFLRLLFTAACLHMLPQFQALPLQPILMRWWRNCKLFHLFIAFLLRTTGGFSISSCKFNLSVSPSSLAVVSNIWIVIFWKIKSPSPNTHNTAFHFGFERGGDSINLEFFPTACSVFTVFIPFLKVQNLTFPHPKLVLCLAYQ